MSRGKLDPRFRPDHPVTVTPQAETPSDPPQTTTGTRRRPPATRSQSAPADGTLPLGPGLNWQPFNTGGR